MRVSARRMEKKFCSCVGGPGNSYGRARLCKRELPCQSRLTTAAIDACGSLGPASQKTPSVALLVCESSEVSALQIAIRFPYDVVDRKIISVAQLRANSPDRCFLRQRRNKMRRRPSYESAKLPFASPLAQFPARSGPDSLSHSVRYPYNPLLHVSNISINLGVKEGGRIQEASKQAGPFIQEHVPAAGGDSDYDMGGERLEKWPTSTLTCRPRWPPEPYIPHPLL